MKPELHFNTMYIAHMSQYGSTKISIFAISGTYLRLPGWVSGWVERYLLPDVMENLFRREGPNSLPHRLYILRASESLNFLLAVHPPAHCSFLVHARTKRLVRDWVHACFIMNTRYSWFAI